jgi:hypothetical protein
MTAVCPVLRAVPTVSVPPASVTPTEVPVRSEVPLKLVAAASRLISSWRAVTSVLMLAASEEPTVALAASTPSSRTRWIIEVISVRAPAAVWTIDTPSWALRWAWLSPVTCACSLLLIARPAASSAAVLIRRPLERR